MLNYVVCEISGKQYQLVLNKELIVDYIGEVDQLKTKVLLKSEDGKVSIGQPYLKEEVNLKIVGSGKKEKIRVAKFHAKANFRKVYGSRAKYSTVVLAS